MKKSLPDHHILIVDDDRIIGEPMREFLEMSDYTAFMVESAEKAIEFIETHNVDAVITDIILPGMNGLELTDFLKNNYNVDVIVMTGYSDDFSYEEAISKGASDFVFKPVRYTELLLRLKRVLRERRLALERNEMLDKLKKLAITDGLTGLYNLRYFYEQLAIEIGRFDRYHHPLSLLLMDIDYFKHYNDTYGHLEGDKVLIELAKIISGCLRKMDTGYRYGGEEFTVILPETCLEKAMIVAERIKTDLSEVIFLPKGDNHPVFVTISIGVTEYRSKEDISEFVQRADKAMYISKENGRDRVSALAAPTEQRN